MSHHGHEDSMERYYAECDREALPKVRMQLANAIELIETIARSKTSVAKTCDNWLEVNGFECEASRRRQRERRAEQLDAEIDRLRAEREKLGG